MHQKWDPHTTYALHVHKYIAIEAVFMTLYHKVTGRSASPRTRTALANPYDHLWGIRMPHAKFHADPLKTVAVHKEAKNRQAHTH